MPFRALSELTFRYFAYYEHDIGHKHDVEIVDVTLRIVVDTPCVEARVVRIVGAAHGADWYSNVVDVEADDADDTVMPPHILVEEGKHASAPDRNADGWFTPGYDATRQVNDAWGVRDAFRNRRTPAFAYSTAVAKDRCSAPRMAVARPWFQEFITLEGFTAREYRRASPCLQQFAPAQRVEMLTPYVLLEAGGDLDSWSYCTREARRRVSEDLRDYLDKWRFCAPTTVEGSVDAAASLAKWFVHPTRLGGTGGVLGWLKRIAGSYSYYAAWRPGVTERAQVGRHRLVVQPALGFELPLLTGWIVPRWAFDLGECWPKSARASPRRCVWPDAIDILYNRSASRAVDFYFGAGWEPNEAMLGGFVQEVGLKMHAPLLPKIRKLVRVGIGLRGRMHREPAELGLVVELGWGGW